MKNHKREISNTKTEGRSTVQHRRLPARNDFVSESMEEMFQIIEEYSMWKRYRVFLYDLQVTHPLQWPSLTVQWLPELIEPPGKDYYLQKMILGTNASGNEPNHILIAQVQIPLEECDYMEPYDDLRGSDCASKKIQVIQQVKHLGKVTRARYMPQNPSFIATQTTSSVVYLFDFSSHEIVDGEYTPDLTLKGVDSEGGHGLSWSPFKQGHLLSCSNDSHLCLWDTSLAPRNKELDANQTFTVPEGVFMDVAWHLRDENLFGSVGSDKCLRIWDLRFSLNEKPAQSVIAHDGEVLSLAFNPFNNWVLATGSTDKTVKLFDIRMICKPLHTCLGCKNGVSQVEWNQKIETVLAASCQGRRIVVWDLGRIGDEQSAEDAEEGPPELFFVHAGHTGEISDFAWNPHGPGMVASVASNSIVQVWEIAQNILYDYGDDTSSPADPMEDGKEGQGN